MKKFQQLRIKCKDHKILVGILSEMKEVKSKLFHYNEEMSLDYAKNVFTTIEETACFKTENESLFKAIVWMSISDDVLWVTNITSTENSSLGISNYNMILLTFFDEIVKPVLNNHKELLSDNEFQTNLTGEEVSISSMLCDETYKLLSHWEKTCNHSAPISHPEDMEAWQDFVISYVFNEQPAELKSSDLFQWLSEDCHWSSAYNEEINKVCNCFEYSVDLLYKVRNEK